MEQGYSSPLPLDVRIPAMSFCGLWSLKLTPANIELRAHHWGFAWFLDLNWPKPLESQRLKLPDNLSLDLPADVTTWANFNTFTLIYLCLHLYLFLYLYFCLMFLYMWVYVKMYAYFLPLFYVWASILMCVYVYIYAWVCEFISLSLCVSIHMAIRWSLWRWHLYPQGIFSYSIY